MGVARPDRIETQIAVRQADARPRPLQGCPGHLEVTLARSEEDIRACQRLRYEVFYEEMAAQPVGDMAALRLDHDALDPAADHLMVLDKAGDQRGRRKVVGTYRLLRQDIAEAHGGFYTAGEFDIAPMLARAGPDTRFLELGRSCVHKDYRTRATINLLWRGIGGYVAEHGIDAIFGCASFPGTDTAALAQPLSLLHHTLQTPAAVSVRALEERYVTMNIVDREAIDERCALRQLPPLIRGYLRAGCLFGDGAVIDHQFSTVDVFVLLQLRDAEQRYLNRFAS